MAKPEDHAMGDVGKDYCLYCARPDGTMKSYEEALVGMTHFAAQSQGLSLDAAREVARGMMAELPAWKGRAG